jgi:hypothetical protein
MFMSKEICEILCMMLNPITLNCSVTSGELKKRTTKEAGMSINFRFPDDQAVKETTPKTQEF